MELNMAYVVSERPAVGRSGPMVDPEGLSRCPSLFPDWPCTVVTPNYCRCTKTFLKNVQELNPIIAGKGSKTAHFLTTSRSIKGRAPQRCVSLKSLMYIESRARMMHHLIPCPPCKYPPQPLEWNLTTAATGTATATATTMVRHRQVLASSPTVRACTSPAHL